METMFLSAQKRTATSCLGARDLEAPEFVLSWVCNEFTQIHSSYRRKPMNLPCTGRRIRLLLSVRKFFCRVVSCIRKIFTEWIPVTDWRLSKGATVDVVSFVGQSSYR